MKNHKYDNNVFYSYNNHLYYYFFIIRIHKIIIFSKLKINIQVNYKIRTIKMGNALSDYNVIFL